jgi:hypothetical protein
VRVLLYSLVRGDAFAKAAVSLQHGYSVMRWESRLGLFFERDVQRVALDHGTLLHLVNLIYTYGHFPVVFLFGAWVFRCRRRAYPLWRNTLLFSLGLSALLYVTYPLAPPRYYPQLGFVDTLAAYSKISYATSGVNLFYNPFAAMPSLHFGWSALVGVGFICLVKHRVLRYVGALVPLMMWLSITATANHFIVDAMAGGSIMLLSYYLAKGITGRRLALPWRRSGGR